MVHFSRHGLLQTIAFLGIMAMGLLEVAKAGDSSANPLWAHDNLIAWCAVPYDGKGRGPTERAEMLQRLGFKHFAYDWRDKDIPTFDAEIEALQKHHIDLLAWWYPLGLSDAQQTLILETFKRHNVHPQLWVAGGGAFTQSTQEQKDRVEEQATLVANLAKKVGPYGCKVELYNHNGWFGNEDNQLAIIDRLNEMGVMDVGMVYNFSHAHDNDHDDTTDFGALWKKIMPHVVAVNVVGLEDDWQPIIYLGHGNHEMDMMKVIQDSGWQGPVGLVAEKGGGKIDAEVTLGNYMKGLDWLAREIASPGSGGPRPLLTGFGPGHFGTAMDAVAGGITLPNRDDLRTPPITVELWARLHSAGNFNVLISSDPKSSGQHWELYSYLNSGNFAVYLPGMGGEVQSTAPICDDAWHYLAMVLDATQVSLYVDGKMVKQAAITNPQIGNVAGDIGIGQIANGDGTCDGLIQQVRISKGIRDITQIPQHPFERDVATLELWPLDKLPAQ